MFVEDIFREFSFDLEVRNFSDRTIESYRNNNKRFFDFLLKNYEIDQLEQIKVNHIKSYLMQLKQKGRKETYINGIFKSIRAFFRYCIQEEYLEEKKNPCLKVKWLKEPTTIIKTFNDEEVKRMINVYHTRDYLNARNKLIILMLVDVGIRNRELCTLPDNQVLDSTILINGKSNKQRFVYISQYLKKYIIKYERTRKGYFKDRILAHDNYFLSRTGKPLTGEAIERIVKIAGEKAKVRKEIRCSPHTLRHYFTQKMLGSSDVYSISRLLGHESIHITKRYLQSMEDDQIIENTRSVSPLMDLRG